VSFDLSLARGLDYYTGVIYEAVLIQPAKSAKDDDAYTGLGSIAAGGRYDELVSIFSSGKGKAGQIPCVGMSIGIERVYSILLKKQKLEDIKSNEVQVYVIAVGQGHIHERMKICKELWDNDIKVIL
jgi:histidyl-tRNA synthetase